MLEPVSAHTPYLILEKTGVSKKLLLTQDDLALWFTSVRLRLSVYMQAGLENLKVKKGLGLAVDGLAVRNNRHKYTMRAVIEAACVCVCVRRCILRELFVNPIIVTMSAQIKPRRRVWGQEDGRSLIRLIKC